MPAEKNADRRRLWAQRQWAQPTDSKGGDGAENKGPRAVPNNYGMELPAP